MDIKGKVHCFFEQSGTFKNEFIKLGIQAEDYDIQNEYGETDHVVDLFAEIDKAWEGRPSIFDAVAKDDLIMAFFPCIYFCAMSQVAMSWGYTNYRKMSIREKTTRILERDTKRSEFYKLAVKMLAIAEERGLRLIMENPWSLQTYLKANFVKAPSIVDNDRTKRGDIFKKPTAYWFIGCEPTSGESLQKDKETRRILDAAGSKEAGLCSDARSAIHPDYARNFICDFILGVKQDPLRLAMGDLY